ncbi:hypothetical protein [Sinosporangium siamense]|uniref:hypothetical protein n=1 Tax=Sinosporangium siamense TaxID=1367973 RepID=UPI00194F1394|nr:hypothetical protein [Sinosporangium siamense]
MTTDRIEAALGTAILLAEHLGYKELVRDVELQLHRHNLTIPGDQSAADTE